MQKVVRWKAGPRKEEEEVELWENGKTVLLLIFIWTWGKIEVVMCMFVLGSLSSEIVAVVYNLWGRGKLNRT